MKTRVVKLFSAPLPALLFAVAFVPLSTDLSSFGSPEAGAPSTTRVIVVFSDDVSDAARDEVLARVSARAIDRFHHALSADVVEGLTAGEVARLREDPRTLRIDEDVLVYAQELRNQRSESIRDAASRTEPVRGQAKKTGTTQAAEMLPWGVDRIDAELVWPSGNTGDPIKVGIIDTGISLSHPDLKENIKGGYNAIKPSRSANDDNGHGSHVAGIVAGVSNSFGVVGAAPRADLYAIKVLSASGSGYLSDIIEGLDWAISRDLDVVNLSLGTSANVASLHEAITRTYNAGIVIAAAAGNSGGSVIYPAAYEEAIAVAATDVNNNLASFSSRGPEVDLAAPGVSIYSTYKGTAYKTLSGTSMAAPHVAGAAALLLATPVGAFDENGNNRWDPSEVVARLSFVATDLGAPGADQFFGAGLVSALAALP